MATGMLSSCGRSLPATLREGVGDRAAGAGVMLGGVPLGPENYLVVTVDKVVSLGGWRGC